MELKIKVDVNLCGGSIESLLELGRDSHRLLHEIKAQLAHVSKQLVVLKKQGDEEMTKLDALEAQVAETEGVEQSAVVLLTGIGTEIQSLIDQLTAAGVDATQAQALADRLAASRTALAAAVAATPPAPTP